MRSSGALWLLFALGLVGCDSSVSNDDFSACRRPLDALFLAYETERCEAECEKSAQCEHVDTSATTIAYCVSICASGLGDVAYGTMTACTAACDTSADCATWTSCTQACPGPAADAGC